MTKQEVDTVKIESAANSLSAHNKNIDKEFQELQKKAGKLGDDWKGSAGNDAYQTMHNLFEINKTRSGILQFYVDTLKQVISPRHQFAEDTSKKLADQFK